MERLAACVGASLSRVVRRDERCDDHPSGGIVDEGCLSSLCCSHNGPRSAAICPGGGGSWYGYSLPDSSASSEGLRESELQTGRLPRDGASSGRDRFASYVPSTIQ